MLKGGWQKVPTGIYKRSQKGKKSISEAMMGKNNPNYKKGNYCNQKLNSETIFKRDNFRCLLCGKRYDSYFLVLHFDTPRGYPTNNPDNIITLCQKCKKVVEKGSMWGRTKKNKNGISGFIIDRWNKEDILNFRVCRKQTEIVYPAGGSPNKKWYSIVYAGGKRAGVNPHYKERTPDEIIEGVVNFTKEELKEAMIKVLRERGQDPGDWEFEKKLVAESVGI